jgi:hypothetical protein
MNDKTGGNRGLWDAGALAVAAVVTVLAMAWGGGSAPSAASTSVAYTQETLAQHIALRACQLLLPPGAHVSITVAE